MISIKNPMKSGMSPIFPQQKQYVIVDWANFVRRAYHSTDRPKALELLIFMLAKLRREYPGAELVVALEGDGREIRARMFPGYKGDRKRDLEFEGFMAKTLKLLDFMRGKLIKAPHGEADDAIACFVQKLEKGERAFMISEDRDLWQLIRGERVCAVVRKGGLIDAHKCKETLGVPPENVACMKAFLGDSDNIPRGVPRMKTVLLTELAGCGTSPGAAYRVAKAKGVLTGKQLERVVKYREQIELNYRLVKLRDGLRLLSKRQDGNPTGLMKFLAEQQLYRVDVPTIDRLTRKEPS